MANVKWQIEEKGRTGGRSHDIPTRAFDFGVRIVKLGRFMYRRPDVPRRLIDQLVSCGTSVGANIEEGQSAHSRADFVAKYGIALREARESAYRLRLFIASEVLTSTDADELMREAIELTRMIGKAIVTAKKNADIPP